MILLSDKERLRKKKVINIWKLPGEGRLQRMTIAVVVSFALSVTLWPVEWAYANKKEELNKQLDDIKEKKGETEKDIQKLKEKIDEKKKVLSGLERKVEVTRKELNQAEKRLEKAQETLEQYNGQYKKSVRNMYLYGDMGRMESLLSAESFNQFLTRFELMRLMVKRDHTIVKKYYDEKEKVEKERDKIKKLTDQQEKEAAEAKKVYDELVVEMKKNESALASLSNEEKITKEELAQLNLEHIKAGNFAYTGPLTVPVPNGRRTSPYGYRGGEFHTGVDWAAPVGTPIVAAADGKVIRSQSCACGYGYYIIIDHGGGIFSLYAHMWASSVRVSSGAVVRKGQTIAGVGNNGRSTGPHLHFEVHRGRLNNHVNPYNYIR
ncbi:murein hydrolase activator EnvC family protein [Desmospora profundinema]|uniref:Murein DD-endopeptidase MepM/ murein hydrolase activator NlpD n=1 Tax=Desmospora profundinema TaxID=1571184 RepID=A0ABU1IIG3_9BACL|nr:peptidoglycan DD-metalloendopeptidase family protein [Desmospora profundinema]MDR6224565.1 murein DD-endopeptidase MepM/ murein hydrolase activator NlpD [Desmospora profundinema]